ncbi:BLUF domain-containing protein [Hydrogenophaga sp.]|uniref:BLUF domain-containing protein n=1 Tax=Hydrogenophaga sp. TaxID=1904254 RepID=UPI0026085E73|nr:BLUF domain-containing protein [Hydrogenophaga sp.]
MNQLIRLVYASRSVTTPSATHQGLDPGIARILAKSRKNNARLDVVGGLLFGDGYFLQCLEGDARIVQNLYSKIENDPRHRDVTVLLQSSINTRTFGAWSMKYVPGEQRLQALLRQWGGSEFDPYQLTKDQIDAAVRFMRNEDDAVDTVPSELQALAAGTDPVVQPARRASPRAATPGQPSKIPPAAAPGSTSFVKVVVGVALACLAALVIALLR